MRRRLAAWGLVCLSLLPGCAFIWVDIPARQPLETPPFELLVGAAKVDITPIPGIPMGGFSGSGKIARGVWNRLYARAIYVVDATGDPLVLVSCDLLQMPTGLADRVAERIGDEPTLAHIGRENLVLAATHTHHGPAAFFSSLLNTSDTSPSPEKGFDPELFEFLARRIEHAVAQAVAAAQPALLFVNHARDGDATDNIGVGLFRNRSVDAFLLNPEAPEFLASASPSLVGCPRPPGYPSPLSCQAIVPDVEVLSFVKRDDPSQVIALAGFLATHPTVLGAQTEVYSGDLFGATASLLEQEKIAAANCPQGGEKPVVALFNGAQGDVSPAWTQRDRADLLGLAEHLGSQICGLLPGTQVSPVDVSFRFDVIGDLADRSFVEDGFTRRTDPSAAPGQPELGGAEDGRTLFYEMGMQEGQRAPKREEHGPKQVALGPLGKLVFWFSPPPRRAPIGVFGIGPITVVSLPGEFTTMMGERVRHTVSDQLASVGPRPDRVLLAGLANGHVSYVSTPEEYDAQHFEGASNFYGAATGPYLAHRLGELAVEPESSAPHSAHRCYRAWDRGRFQPGNAWGPPYRVDDGLPELARDLTPPRLPRRDFPAFCWYDSLPRLSSVEEAGGCVRSMPEVSVESEATGVVADAEGLEIVTVMVGVARRRTEWCSIWLVPESLRQDESEYRFRAARIRGADAVSHPFVPAQVFDAANPTPFLDRRSTEDLRPPSLAPYDACEEVDPFP